MALAAKQAAEGTSYEGINAIVEDCETKTSIEKLLKEKASPRAYEFLDKLTNFRA